MKKILLLIMIAFTSFIVNAQTSNNTRLDQIENEIKTAVENGDYDKANLLKQEKEVRLKIKNAIETGDFDEAERLKSQLSKINSNTSTANNSTGNYEETKTTNADSPTGKNKLSKNGVFLDALLGFRSVTRTSQDYYSQGYLGVGVRFGYKWYFREYERYTPGFQIIWIRAELLTGEGIESINISPFNVGFTNLFNMNNIGIEANLNFGLNETHLEIPDFIYTGLIINPTVKFRFKNLAVGIDIAHMGISKYRGSDPLYDYTRGKYTSVGLTFGLKF